MILKNIFYLNFLLLVLPWSSASTQEKSTVRNKISGFAVGASLALGTELLINHSLSSSSLKHATARFLTRIGAAFLSTVLLNHYITNKPDFFDFFGIGTDSIIIANTLRLFAFNFHHQIIDWGLLIDLITLGSSIMDIHSKLPLRHRKSTQQLITHVSINF